MCTTEDADAFRNRAIICRPLPNRDCLAAVDKISRYSSLFEPKTSLLVFVLTMPRTYPGNQKRVGRVPLHSASNFGRKIVLHAARGARIRRNKLLPDRGS